MDQLNNVVTLDTKRRQRAERDIFERWIKFYNEQAHEDLLEALVYEHEHDFPLRRSSELMDQLRHKALVQVLTERAQTEFLKSFLEELKAESAQI